jgi:hypothetical protein
MQLVDPGNPTILVFWVTLTHNNTYPWVNQNPHQSIYTILHLKNQTNLNHLVSLFYLKTNKISSII